MFHTFFKKFCVLENLFAVVTKLNKIRTKKKAKSFQLPTLPYNMQKLKFYFILQILSSNEILEVALAFQKYQSTGHQKIVEEDTSQEKLLLMLSYFSSQNVDIKIISFLSLLYICVTCRAIFHHQYSMVQ